MCVHNYTTTHVHMHVRIHIMQVSEKLRLLLLQLYDKHMNEDGTKVDYDGLRQDPEFRRYVDAAAELQHVDVHSLQERDKAMCFWINVYNSLVVHALTVLGPAKNTLERLKWFDDVSYHIGGYRFSANDIEHGILRGNAPSPASPWSLLGFPSLAKRTFRSSDPRGGLALKTVDPRIHFALNCGAVSCPPIKVYSTQALEEGLYSAAQAFCSGDVHVDKNEVVLSSIFKWYGKDFGKDSRELITYILPYVLPGELI